MPIDKRSPAPVTQWIDLKDHCKQNVAGLARLSQVCYTARIASHTLWCILLDEWNCSVSVNRLPAHWELLTKWLEGACFDIVNRSVPCPVGKPVNSIRPFRAVIAKTEQANLIFLFGQPAEGLANRAQFFESFVSSGSAPSVPLRKQPCGAKKT